MKDYIRELINFVGNHDDYEATWRKNDSGYTVYDGSYQFDCRDTFNSISNYAGWKFRERGEKPVGILRKCYEEGLVADHFADDGTMFLKITDKALEVIAEHEADILDHIDFIKEDK
tara:strand:+ start:232 stop:579 length:348 start_codon:yes stop_codon:yes gene_type:complete